MSDNKSPTTDKCFVVTSPDNQLENHIKSVEVYSGPDGYEANTPKGFVITGNGDGSVQCTPQKENGKLYGRFRGQPCVKINLNEEHELFEFEGEVPHSWSLIIYFHKGSICMEKIKNEKVKVVTSPAYI